MSTTIRLISIKAVAPPGDIGQDPQDRVMFSTNYEIVSSGRISQIEEAIIKLIENANLLHNTDDNLFIGRIAQPDNINHTGPYCNVILTGGFGSDQTQNNNIQDKFSLQLVVRGQNYFDARNKSMEIFSTLSDRYNIEVTLQ